MALPAFAGVITANFNSATSIPVTAASYTATSNTVNLSLGFAPPTGTNLTVVKNTGLAFIQGTFGNLSQGQYVTLTYSGAKYRFVANYYGGTGNDLVLQWPGQQNLATWGNNMYGALGHNDIPGVPPDSYVPAAIDDATGVLNGKTVVAVDCGGFNTLALCSDGTVAVWGDNLGNNSTTYSYIPVSVDTTGVLNGKTVIAVSAGGGVNSRSHSLALCSDGTAVAWGSNRSGQLGNNNVQVDSSVPVAVDSHDIHSALRGKKMVAISAGGTHSLAICSDGTVVAWGNNSSGQLGNNSLLYGSQPPSYRSVPVAVDTTGALRGKKVVAVSAGRMHSLVLCSDGTVAAWGRNAEGQLGNNSTTNCSVPVAVDTTGVLGGKTVVAVAAGDYHSLALCSDGTVAAWGYNYYGQLGNNNTNDSSVPVAFYTTTGVLSGKTVVAVSAGDNRSLALCSDGSVAGCGRNYNGELGNYSKLAVNKVPIAVDITGVLSGKTVVAVAAGGQHSVALVTGLSNISTLSDIALSSGSLSPAFVPLTTGYVANVPNTTTSLTLTPVTAENNAGVRVNGVDVVSGEANAAIPLVVGDNAIPVEVTAQDGISTKTYMVTVKRPPSSIATLSGLGLSSGNFSPAFTSNTANYTASVANTVTSIKVTPTTSDTAAKVRVNGTLVASGAASASIPLAAGTNTITTLVTAQNGTSVKTYTIKVTRAKSPDATLSGLVVKTAILSQKFKPTTTGYTASVSVAIKSVKIRATAAHGAAKIKINGTAVKSGNLSAAIPLNSRKTVIKVVVTAQNGSSKTYKITVSWTAFRSAQARPDSLASAMTQSLPHAPEETTVSKVMRDGKKYLQLTIRRNPGSPKPVVEVSPNLVDWFSGDKHTTTVVDNGRIFIIRDNTPITPAAKRFIRANKR